MGGITVFLGIRSLAGLGPVRKWVAIGVRLAVLLLVILILGDIKLVRKNTDVELMIVRDISQSTGLVSDFPGKFLQSSIDDYLLAATAKANSPSRQRRRSGGGNQLQRARVYRRDSQPVAFAGGAGGARRAEPERMPPERCNWAWRRWGTIPCTGCC